MTSSSLPFRMARESVSVFLSPGSDVLSERDWIVWMDVRKATSS